MKPIKSLLKTVLVVVPDFRKKALVKLTPRGIGCGGYNANSAGFANAKEWCGRSRKSCSWSMDYQNAEIEAGNEILIVLAPQIKRLTFLPSLRRNISIMI